MAIKLAFKMFAELARYAEGIDIPGQRGPDHIVESLKLVIPSVEFSDEVLTIRCHPRDPAQLGLLAEVATMISLYGIDSNGHRLPGEGISFDYANWGRHIFVDYPYKEFENVARVDVDIAP